MRFNLYASIAIVLISCSSPTSESNKIKDIMELNAEIQKQQKMIDSLLRKESNRRDSIFISKSKQIEEVIVKEKAGGFNLNEISDDNVRRCPVQILNLSKKYKSDFLSSGELTAKNNYSSTAISIELDFGISKKRIKCKVPPKKSNICSVNLTEEEADNNLTFLVDGINYGLNISKVVFSNGYMWSK